jgi:transcriptional regulator GlxA family with amidase domain
LLVARVRQARHLLETTDQPVERIASRLGFGGATFRDQFRRRVGASPTAYRRAFRGLTRRTDTTLNA